MEGVVRRPSSRSVEHTGTCTTQHEGVPVSEVIREALRHHLDAGW